MSIMKFLALAVLAVPLVSRAARLDNTYLPPANAATAGGAGLKAPNGFGSRPGGYQGGASSTSFGSRPAPNFGSPSVPFNNGIGRGGVERIPSGGPSYSGGGGNSFGGGGGGGGVSFGGGGGGGGGQPSGPPIPIVSYDSQNDGVGGNYQFSYETGNGIRAQENGDGKAKWIAVSGSYSYTGPDGNQYAISYTADENGYRPQGAHLPTPPPIPPEIQRGIELALAAEARGENQDGAYKEDNGGRGGGGGSFGGGGGNFASGGGGGGRYQGQNSFGGGSSGGSNEGYRY